jgi:nucleoid DNA-binding protein
MTRADLVQELSRQCGLSTRHAGKALNAILSTMLEVFQAEGTLFQRVERRDNGHFYLVPIQGTTLRRNAIEIRGFGRFFSEARRKPPFYSATVSGRCEHEGAFRCAFARVECCASR